MKIKPRTQKDFEWVNWTPKQISDAAKKIIQKQQENIEKIKAIPKEERNFENSIYALDALGDVPGFNISCIGVLAEMSPRKDQRDAAFKAVETVEKQMTDLIFDRDLYKAFKEYNPKKEKLSEADKQLYKDTKLFYEKAGFDLPDEDFNKLKKIKKRLAVLSSQFSKNNNNFSMKVLLSEKELSGLPQNFIDGLETDKKTGKKIIDKSYPVVRPFLEFADSPVKKQEVADKVSQKGGFKNLKILEEIFKLRQEQAKLLGYKNHVEYSVEHRISKSQKNIKDFLEGTVKKIQPNYISFIKDLDVYKKKISNTKKGVEYFDVEYYKSKFLQDEWGLDAKELKEYFELENVIKGMFEIFGDLFGISFKESSNFKLWHEDARVFDVYEKANVIGHLCLDLFPREGKYGHMACWTFLTGHCTDFSKQERNAPFTLIMGNFPKPTLKNPALLSMKEVDTLFHEFGHACHGLLSRAPYESQYGTSVDFDFVEVPSQLFENWVYTPESLKKIAKHYKTEAILPKELMQKVIDKHFSSIIRDQFYIFIDSLIDQDYHSGKKINSLNDYYKKIHKKYKVVKNSPKSLNPAGWGHMGSGYGGSYYAYMFSLVMSYDFFSRFQQEGVLNKKTGRALRTVLEKGGSEDEIKYIKEFLGRKPNNKAFLKALGIGK